MRGFLDALAFLTVLPAGARRDENGGLGLAGATWAFPLVGLVVAGILAGADFLLSRVASPLSSSVLTVTIWVLVTGAMNLDGLSDTADGFMVSALRERRLEIMRDSHVGAFGAVALVLLLVAKVAFLSALRGQGRLFALLFAPAFSRVAVVLVAGFVSPARKDGMGKALAANGLSLAVNTLTISLLIVGFGFPAALAAVAVAVTTFAWCAIALLKIGGYTGDVLGAIIETSEAAVLLALGLKLF